MNLDKLTIDIRPRRPWEAVDLGILMARRWWGQLVSIWLIIVTPIFFLLCFLPTEYLLLQGVILWWLKPLFERPLLYVLSRTVFGEFPSTREAINAAPKLALKQIFMSLIWRRLSMTRSFDLPVIQLEGLRGKQRSERLTVLHREGVTPASALTIFILHIQQFLSFAIVGLLVIFIPETIEVDWFELFMAYENENRAIIIAFNFIGMLCSASVAPFYVASGFALYLNRRVKLEAWDLEIAFKRMVQQRDENKGHNQKDKPQAQSKKRDGNAASISMCLVLASACFFANPSSVNAEEEIKPLLQEQTFQEVRDVYSAAEVIDSIKKLDAFNTRDTLSYPKFDFEPEEEVDDEDLDLSWLESLAGFFKLLSDIVTFLASAGQWLLWLLVLSLVALLVYRYRHWIAEYANFHVPSEQKFRPEVMFGMEVTKESLPDDVGAAALAHWNNGEGRQALALLYRASLFQLLECGVDFLDGDTEGVCLEKAKRYKNTPRLKSGTRLSYFESLTRVWQRHAYGHFQLDGNIVEPLCTQWQSVWAENAGASSEGAADVE